MGFLSDLGLELKKRMLIALGIGAFFVIALIVFVTVSVTVGTLFFGSKTEYSREYDASSAAGREFGKNSDQQGCVEQGLSRLKGVNESFSNAGHLAAGTAFVTECLKASRPTPGFCDGIPSWWKFEQYEWEEEQCKKIGLDACCDGCRAVFGAKYDVCTGWE